MARRSAPAYLIKAECGAKGHDFEAWRTCRCRGSLPKHEAAMTVDDIVVDACPVQVRWCQRCRHKLEDKYPENDDPTAWGSVDSRPHAD